MCSSLAGCGKTPPRAGFGKGTSSTRAVTASKSTAASSRWGKAALEEHIFRSLLRQVIKEIVLRHFADGGQRGLVIGLGLGEIGCGHRQIGAAKSGLLLAQL